MCALVVVVSTSTNVEQASPRKDITKLCRVPNWSPTVDFVTTTGSSRWDSVDSDTSKAANGQRQHGFSAPPTFSKPDKIYAAAGRGLNGSVVEYRHGLQANIGIEFDYGAVIKRSFMFQENPLDPASGYLLLLSLPGKSALLYFDSKFTAASATELEEDQTAYELSCSTFLATPVDEATILQVTEEDIAFVGPETRYCQNISLLTSLCSHL